MIDVDSVLLSVSPVTGDSEMAVEIPPCPNTPFWREKLYADSHHNDGDQRFFVDALKSGHLEGKMSAREMTFAMNIPPVRAVGSAP